VLPPPALPMLYARRGSVYGKYPHLPYKTPDLPSASYSEGKGSRPRSQWHCAVIRIRGDAAAATLSRDRLFRGELTLIGRLSPLRAGELRTTGITLWEIYALTAQISSISPCTYPPLPYALAIDLTSHSSEHRTAGTTPARNRAPDRWRQTQMADAKHVSYAEFLKENKLAEGHRIPYYVRWVEA